jgi:unsaturated chondroitin disaccharide hydrolase
MSTHRPLALITVLLLAPALGACHRQQVRPEAPLAPASLSNSAVDETLAFAAQQVAKTEQRLAPNAHPRFTAVDFAGGQWVAAERTDWRSGFFGGLEWLMFEKYGTDLHGWRALAEDRTQDFADEVSRPQTHDVGFKTLTTYGNGYRLTHRADYLPKIFAGANTLAARFLPAHGVTQSWGNTVGSGDLRVIIDNMMNLELFFLAAELTTDAADRERWLRLGFSHARTTERNQVRHSADPLVDGSTCHVFFYNLGVCRAHQGLADGSTWARGQAWAMHGFTTSYEHARRYPAYAADAELFLATAQRAADLYLRRLAEPKHGDWVPLHDFDAPAGNPKDSSAAAIAASALLELSRLPAVAGEKRVRYRVAAEHMLDDLRAGGGVKPYRETAAGAEAGGETILLRATTTYRGAGHADNRDVERGLSYADYYYVEALLREQDLYGPAPRAPGFLAATAGPSGVVLGWTATRGAAHYTIKRATAAGGHYVAVGTTVEPGYVDAGAGVGGFYLVTATNQAAVESGPSNEVAVSAR